MTHDSAVPLVGVLNAGSSSLKFAFYEGERAILTGQVDGIGVHPSAKAAGGDGKALAPPDLGAIMLGDAPQPIGPQPGVEEPGR